MEVTVTKKVPGRSLKSTIFPLNQPAVRSVCRMDLAYILALMHPRILCWEQRVSPAPHFVLRVTEPFAVVRIPPSAVLSCKNAPATPASCLRVRHVNEPRHNDLPHVAIPIQLDQPEEDSEFALTFALSIQMLAIPSTMSSNETDLTLI